MSLVTLVLFVLTVNIVKSAVIFVNPMSPHRTNSSSCWSNIKIPCDSLELGLQGIHHLLLGEEDDVTLLIAGGMTYYLDESHSEYTQFFMVSNLEISGHATKFNTMPIAIIKCEGEVGFSFIYSTNIGLSNIVFDGCGELRNSTSYNFDPVNPDYVQFVVSLYFLYCTGVAIDTVNVTNTLGMGAVIYNTVGNVLVTHSNFVANRFQPETQLSGGGGLYIEFSYCDPLNTSCLLSNESNVNTSYTSNAQYTIKNTAFYSNRANMSLYDISKATYILPLGKDHTAFGRGGGLSLYVIGSATGLSFEVDTCSFVNNTALWGGGLLVEFHDNAHHNFFIVRNSQFVDNSLDYNKTFNHGTGGGGARVTMFMFTERNSIIYGNVVIFSGCIFISNEAYYGGGFSFYTTVNSVDNASQPNYNQVQFFGCSFIRNTARLGAAFAISVYPPSKSLNGTNIYPFVTIQDLLVMDNKAEQHHGSNILVGVGAVYVDTVSVQFEGKNEFFNNFGSALALTNCQINVLENTEMVFISNTGRNGGGIVLYANAFIVTHPHSSMNFTENTADQFGGAIYSQSPGIGDQFGSGNCLLRFSDIFVPPYQWTSRFYFKSNKAKGHPNSIYASTLLPCVSGLSDGQSNHTFQSTVQKTFCWSDNWIYHNESNQNQPCHEQIKTAGSSYTLRQLYKVIPGYKISLDAQVEDNMDNSVINTTVFIARILNGSASFSSDKGTNRYDYISHNMLYMLGKPNSSVWLQVETTPPIVIENIIEVQLQHCPPGFVSDQSSTAECTCNKNTDYGGFIECHDQNFTSSIIHSGWIGKVPGFDDTLLFGHNPNYLKNTSLSSMQYIVLPQDPNQISEFLCDSTNSEGVLCGSCKESYGVVVGSVIKPCIYCPPGIEKYSWIFYILNEFLPVTLFFGIIFIFSMTITFGPLNSYIFFSQVITSVMTIDAEGQIPVTAVTPSFNILQDIYIIPYSIWNMNFFHEILPPYCLSSQLNALSVLNIRFLQAFYPIFLLLLFVIVMMLYNRGTPFIVCCCRPFHRCLARFRQWSNLRQSVTGSMAAFVVIAYTRFVLLAFYILTPADLLYPNGSVAVSVFKFDGNRFYNDPGNIKYKLPSIIVLMLAIIPPVLFAYPTLLRIALCISCRCIPLGKLYPSPKFQAFLDEFHGCYKNGSNGGVDCRWFASLYFCIRMILVLLYSQTDVLVQYTMQSVFFLIIAFLFLVFQPYREPWINKLDITMFLLLAGISIIGTYNLMMTRIGEPLSTIAFAIQYILVMIPLFYCIGYYLNIFCSNNKAKLLKRRRSKRFSSRTVEQRLSADNSYQSTDDELNDSTHVPDFLDFIKTTGRLENVTSRKNRVTPRAINASPGESESSPLLIPAPPPGSYDSSMYASTNYQSMESSDNTD